MSVSESFLTFVLEQLGRVRAVSSRRMFGGVGLYSGETFFAVIDNDTLFFKVDDLTRPRYVKRKMPPFQPMPDQAPMTGYYQVPPGVLEDADELARWGAEAIEVGRRSPTRKKPEARSQKAKAKRKKPKTKNQKRKIRS